MMKLLLSALFLCLSVNAFAKPAFLKQFKKTYPNAKAVSECLLCHVGGDDSVLNNFSNDYMNNGQDYKAIEGFDSDVDGFTNIDEINAGTWPGDVDNHPVQQ